MNDSSDEQGPEPAKSSPFARPLLWLVILVLVVLAAGVASKPLWNKVSLVESEGRASLEFTRFGSIPLVLGPGCSNLIFTPHRDSFDRATLTWSGQGQPRSLQVRWLESGNRRGGAEIGDEWPELGTQAVLLPNGRALFSQAPAGAPLFVLERWEGSLAGTPCTIWVYEPPRAAAPSRDWSCEDGQALGPRTGFERTQGDDYGWELSETCSGGSRAFKVPPGGSRGTYRLKTSSQTLEAVLERTYRGEWSAGDALPE